MEGEEILTADPCLGIEASGEGGGEEEVGKGVELDLFGFQVVEVVDALEVWVGGWVGGLNGLLYVLG